MRSLAKVQNPPYLVITVDSGEWDDEVFFPLGQCRPRDWAVWPKWRTGAKIKFPV
jgi:hypothetical protein